MASRGGAIEANLKYDDRGTEVGPLALARGFYGNTGDVNGFSLESCTYTVGNVACVCTPCAAPRRTATIDCTGVTVPGVLAGLTSNGCINIFYGGGPTSS